MSSTVVEVALRVYELIFKQGVEGEPTLGRLAVPACLPLVQLFVKKYFFQAFLGVEGPSEHFPPSNKHSKLIALMSDQSYCVMFCAGSSSLDMLGLLTMFCLNYCSAADFKDQWRPISNARTGLRSEDVYIALNHNRAFAG
ncbi:UNVERIFIED_CONTAM: hypothetical protein Sangu_3017300 [Sesamum angustifolium]|uniref:Uncharacterized protein n=1 Tax=Sesamum angustifolium TaxID=2727405 RepID=A0AAW2KLA3_9LAMI